MPKNDSGGAKNMADKSTKINILSFGKHGKINACK